MYTKITNNVSITARPSFTPERSRTYEQIYAFSYTIQIQNFNEQTVQLLGRHWIIKSGGRNYDEVIGEGVVGLQPVLKQGQSFEYTSGAIIEDPFGAMHGSYTFQFADGGSFEVEIPEFDLIYQTAVN